MSTFVFFAVNFHIASLVPRKTSHGVSWWRAGGRRAWVGVQDREDRCWSGWWRGERRQGESRRGRGGPRTDVEAWLQKKRILDFSTQTLKLMFHADPNYSYKVLCRAETIDMGQSTGPLRKSQWDEVYSQRFTCVQQIEQMRNLELDSACNIL